jgi:hypothetical protein
MWEYVTCAISDSADDYYSLRCHKQRRLNISNDSWIWILLSIAPIIAMAMG